MSETAREVVTRLATENEQLRQAIGLATTAVPTMEIDVSDPVGMMQRVVNEVTTLRKALKELVEAHDHWFDTGMGEDRAIVATAKAKKLLSE